ncbi:MAG: phosphoribosylaminoimidazolesuccinocarboxamide synthase [Methylacidiphilales bacterium]|nr:phosphoribosylaminoimidazolesuccinocarboxamide synthase [Candidatus Methylacidiphilales bacterium]
MVTNSNQTISFPLISKGKVRDLYEISSDSLLIVASDRFSAFDHIFSQPFIHSNKTLYKGKIITAFSKEWFTRLPSKIKHHFLSTDLNSKLPDTLALEHSGRGMIVSKLYPIPIEAVVRSHLVGTAWTEYQSSNSICNISLPNGLNKYDALPYPIYTPAFKAPVGEKDYNLSYQQTEVIIGTRNAQEIKEFSITVFNFLQNYCAEKGVILLDSKFEFGLSLNNELLLMDELCTPDSSRFLLTSDFNKKVIQHYDKQYVREYLLSEQWTKQSNNFQFPSAIIDELLQRYQQLFEKLFS